MLWVSNKSIIKPCNKNDFQSQMFHLILCARFVGIYLWNEIQEMELKGSPALRLQAKTIGDLEGRKVQQVEWRTDTRLMFWRLKTKGFCSVENPTLKSLETYQLRISCTPKDQSFVIVDYHAQSGGYRHFPLWLMKGCSTFPFAQHHATYHAPCLVMYLLWEEKFSVMTFLSNCFHTIGIKSRHVTPPEHK